MAAVVVVFVVYFKDYFCVSAGVISGPKFQLLSSDTQPN
jgi:hypothetical protein